MQHYPERLQPAYCSKCAVLAAALAGVLTTNLNAQELLWADEFDSGSVPNSDFWSYDLGDSGWGNQELQEYTNNPLNASISEGDLVITARQKIVGEEITGFTSARIRSQDKLMFKYGTIEARIKMPNLDRGLWPAFWTLGNNFSTVGWPAAGELDIVEMGSFAAIAAGETNRRVGSTAHWENEDSHAYYGTSITAAEDLNDDYHLFTMEWTPSLVTTHLDGQQIWAMDITPEKCTDCTEFHAPHFIILNMAVGGNYTGLSDISAITAPFPAEMRVDYVRVYDNGFTEVSGSSLNAPDIGPAHSGSWYNTDQDGHGFSMEFAPLPDGRPIAVIYWYTYDDQGNPIFMLGTGVPEGNRVEVTFESPTGMIYGVFDPDSVERNPGATGVFEFQDRDNATFTYSPSDFTHMNWGHTSGIESLPLIKLLGIPADQEFKSNP